MSSFVGPWNTQNTSPLPHTAFRHTEVVSDCHLRLDLYRTNEITAEDQRASRVLRARPRDRSIVKVHDSNGAANFAEELSTGPGSWRQVGTVQQFNLLRLLHVGSTIRLVEPSSLPRRL